MRTVPRDLTALQSTPLRVRWALVGRRLWESAASQRARESARSLTKTALPPVQDLALQLLIFVFVTRSRGAAETINAPCRIGAASGDSSESSGSDGTYTTPAGLHVRDKRRLNPAKAEVQAEARAEQPSSEGNRPRGRWGYQVDLTRFGRTVKLISKVDLGNAAPAAVSALFFESDAFRLVVTDRGGGPGALVRVLELSSNGACDLRTPVHRWIQRHATEAEISTLVADHVFRKDRPQSPRLDAAVIRLVPIAAGAFTDPLAKDLLSLLLGLTRADLDPYQDNAVHLLARQAVVALLRVRPELIGYVLDSLRLQRPHGVLDQSAGVPVEAELVAIALRERGTARVTGLVQLAEAIGAGERQLRLLSRLADAPLQGTPFPVELNGNALDSLRQLLAVAVPLLVPPAACAAVFVWWKGHRLHGQIAALGAPEAIALIALLATVHVFAVQLSASRLPGSIAQFSSRGWPLYASYSASLSVLGLALWAPESQPGIAADHAAAAVGLGSFLVALLGALFTFLSRTDPARAALGFVHSRLNAARAAGRKFGRIQAKSIELNAAIEDTTRLEVRTDAILDEWQAPIFAKRRGLLVPSKRRLLRLAIRAEFETGMRLRLRSGVGTTVGQDSDIAHLVPTRDQSISRRTRRLAMQALIVRPSGDLEAVGSSAIALLGLATELVEKNDFGTAERVLHNLVRMLAAHVSAASVARRRELQRWEQREDVLRKSLERSGESSFRNSSRSARASSASDDRDVAPVVPAVRDLVKLGTRAALNSEAGTFDLTDILIVPVLRMSGQADSAISMVAFSIPTLLSSDRQVLRAGLLLRVASLRALELRARLQFDLVLDRLDDIERSLGETTTQVRDIASEISALACRFDVAMAADAFKHLAGYYAKMEEPNAIERARLYWRVGAAAVESGATSVAIDVAEALAADNLGEALAFLRQSEENLIKEASRADIFGGYLGDHSRDALANFATFYEAVAPILKPGG